MQELSGETGRLLDRLRAGDARARNDLVAHASARLEKLASRMLKEFPRVARWEETGDVAQNALIRLSSALSKGFVESTRHFWNLAALEIRRELLDLARHYHGKEGQGAKHHTERAGKAADEGVLAVHPDNSGEPECLEEWTRFHQQVSALPEEEQEIFHLLYYGGLSQDEAAGELGISLRTVKRRWQSARLLLAAALTKE